MTEPRLALEGIRIIDLSHVFQGPVGTQILADYGADVIKVERPGVGDWSRSWGPFLDGLSMPYASLNRNKRSVTINLKSEAGRRIMGELAAGADVLVHNFRPGVMEKLGLGYEDLSALNPGIVYARSSGWGDSGPYVDRGRAGHNLMALAAAGWFEPKEPGGLPVRAGMSVDYPAGLMLMMGILMALVSRERTGRGEIVSTDLFSVALHAHVWESAALLNKDRDLTPDGVGEGEGVIDSSFRTSDGMIQISPVFSADPLRDISVAMGLGDLSEDPRFRSQENRIAHKDQLNATLAERFLERPTDEWVSTLESKGVLCGEIQTFEQAVDDPQTHANNMVVEMSQPTVGALRLLGTPVRLGATPVSYRIPPADLGQHTKEVLAELGYSDEEVAKLQDEGVLG